MTRVHVSLLGPLTVTCDGIEAPGLSKSVRQLIGLVAASGKHGLLRNTLAQELWGNELPDSWQSAIRNRMASARKALGSETLLNHSGRLRLADSVTIDSWQLIGSVASPAGLHDLSFLDGEPLADIEPSPLVRRHADQVADARGVRLQTLVSASTEPLPAWMLQQLRAYQRAHPLDFATTEATVRAHLDAAALGQAASILTESRTAAGQRANELGWINELQRLVTSHQPDLEAPATAEATELRRRAELFERAGSNEDWSMALEIAMAGLPLADRSAGDPARLALLEEIPLDKLDAARQFTFCLTLARHLMYAERDDEAVEWSQMARELAHTPEQELLAFITAAVVGEGAALGRPIPLPSAFDQDSTESVNLQSLQVAVMSHLERGSFTEAAPLVRRFAALVDASAEPYRRWHGLLIESMGHFVDGHFEAARDLAIDAYNYADLFGIIDAEVALIGQLSNLHWIRPGLADPLDYRADYAASADSSLSRALQARSQARTDSTAAHEFLASYNYNSRSFYTLSTVIILADTVTDQALRSELVDRLLLDAGTSAISGSGVMHLGPVDRTLARLMTSSDDCERHLRAAIVCADRQRFRVWQVVCRLELAAHTGNDTYRSEAQVLATTSELRQLVASFES